MIVHYRVAQVGSIPATDAVDLMQERTYVPGDRITG
jgi:hypothetical protein